MTRASYIWILVYGIPPMTRLIYLYHQFLLQEAWMMSGLRTGMQPIPMTALIFVLLIVGPGLAWAGKSPLKSEEPHTAMAINEVQALVPEPDLVIRPSFSGDDIFHLDGKVVWDTAQAPIGVLKVNKVGRKNLY